MTKALRTTAVLSAALLVLAACGGDDEPEATADDASIDAADSADADDSGDTNDAEDAEESAPADDFGTHEITLTLNYLAGGPQAGFTYAKELGYYDELGLDVTIQEGEGSATTAQLVATGSTDVGYSDGPSIMSLIAQDAPMTIVAPILQTNGFAIISLADTGIETVGDLVGTTIAVQPGSAQTTLLDAIFETNNISQDDVDLVNIDPSAHVGSLLQGEVDAILGGADHQSILVQNEGFEINELMYRDIGVPTVGLSIVAPNSLIEDDPELVRRFVAASLRGWDAARDDPQAAAQSLVDTFQTADVESILQALEVDLDLLCADGAESLGKPPRENWEATHQLLVEYQNLPETPSIDDYYTEEFIPADAPAC